MKEKEADDGIQCDFDTDDEDAEAAYDAWKLRELKRLKRDRDERDQSVEKKIRRKQLSICFFVLDMNEKNKNSNDGTT